MSVLRSKLLNRKCVNLNHYHIFYFIHFLFSSYIYEIPKAYTLKQIATIINCEYVGDTDFPITGMNEIHVVETGDIVFVDHPKYYDKALNSAATIVLINKKIAFPKGSIVDF
jgi:hypothetical protein